MIQKKAIHRLVFHSFVIWGFFCSFHACGDEVRNWDSQLQLFVDQYVIENMNGTSLRMHSPITKETVLEFDQPWEGRYCGYSTVLFDTDRYRLYYRGLPDPGADGSDAEVTCYAESLDGIHWKKPNLALFEVRGNKENNVILANQAPFSHNFSPFIDSKPGIPSQERYKALAGIQKSGLAGFVSPDGIHWQKIQTEPIITKGAFDSQNLAFWSELEGCYVCYFRSWTQQDYQGYRSISRCTSEDFLHWSDPVSMTFNDTPWEHLYTNQTLPYFRAPQIYLSFPARFMPGRRVLTADEAKDIGVEAEYSGDCSETCLMSSRGGNQFDRTFMEGYIRPGLGAQNWSSRTNYTTYGMIPTSKTEISMYIQRNYGQPTHYLQRLTLRTDGFVSVNAPYRGGEVITKPFRFTGERLILNYSTSAAGKIQVEVQNSDGSLIPGFTLQDCLELIGDHIEGEVHWKDRSDVSAFSGKAIRLRFVMNDADLYSMKWK